MKTTNRRFQLTRVTLALFCAVGSQGVHADLSICMQRLNAINESEANSWDYDKDMAHLQSDPLCKAELAAWDKARASENDLAAKAEAAQKIEDSKKIHSGLITLAKVGSYTVGGLSLLAAFNWVVSRTTAVLLVTGQSLKTMDRISGAPETRLEPVPGPAQAGDLFKKLDEAPNEPSSLPESRQLTAEKAA